MSALAELAERIGQARHPCEVCGAVIFGRARYCSESCTAKASYWRKRTLKPPLSTVCEFCGDAMPEGRYASKRKYCSRACYESARTRRERLAAGVVNRTCPECGKDFSFVPTRGPHRVYCSEECQRQINARKSRAKFWTRPCKVCGAPFEARGIWRQVCSDKCMAKMRANQGLRQRKIWPHTKVAYRECRKCGKWYTVEAKFAKHRFFCGPCGEAVEREKARLADRRQRRARWKPESRTCQECGVTFTPEFGDGRRLYCSIKCGRRHDKRRRSRYGTPIPMAKLYERYGYRCWICRRKVDPAKRYPHPMSGSVDHVVPRSAGGGDEIENLRPAHFRCNAHRGAGKDGEQMLLAV